MNHPHKKNGANADASGQTKTVFLSSTDTIAAIVVSSGKQMATSHRKFRDPHAALTWAIKNDAGFVFFRGTTPEQN